MVLELAEGGEDGEGGGAVGTWRGNVNFCLEKREEGAGKWNGMTETKIESRKTDIVEAPLRRTVVEIRPSLFESPVLLPQLPPKFDLLLPISHYFQLSLRHLLLHLRYHFLHPVRLPAGRNSPVHSPPPIRRCIIRVLGPFSADPPVRTVAHEGFEGPELGREAVEGGGPEVEGGGECRGRGGGRG